jgi:hypothetical protein
VDAFSFKVSEKWVECLVLVTVFLKNVKIFAGINNDEKVAKNPPLKLVSIKPGE